MLNLQTDEGEQKKQAHIWTRQAKQEKGDRKKIKLDRQWVANNHQED